MKIKKISEKLNFDVEAQSICWEHGWGYDKDSSNCNRDCKTTDWTSANYWHAKYGGNTAGCQKETVYSCTWSCKR